MRCLRPDGFRLGQQAAWYSDGQIAEYEWVVEAGERTANDGLEVRWQPDGRLFSIALNRNATSHGPQVTWPIDGLPLTRLYDEGSLVNLYRGVRPPEFRCPDGLRPRSVREGRDVFTSNGSDRLASPFVEHWCEDPSREARPEAVEAGPVVESRRCRRLETGLQQLLGAPLTTRRMVILPPPDDGRSVEAICETTGSGSAVVGRDPTFHGIPRAGSWNEGRMRTGFEMAPG
ncbi:MAG: hypothetical protein GY937_04735 [bacterium]|nr:hypothetical protein [bacterium]